MIQAADVAVTLTYALYKRWGREVQEKFFHLASLMQSAHRAQGQFLHHDAITGTSKDFVVVDFESQLMAAYSGTQSVTKMALQALITKGKVETPYVFHPETVRGRYNESPRKVKLTVPEGGLRVFVYNPLPQYRQQPVHILVDTNRFYIKNHLREIVPCQINPVWEEELTGVKSDLFEVVFVADLPPLATLPFVLFPDRAVPRTSYPARLSIFNSETLVVPPETHFSQAQPETERTQPVAIQNEKVRLRVDPRSGRVLDLQDLATGNTTVLNMQLEVYRSQGSGAYLFRPAGGSEPLISNPPVLRVVEGPVMVQLTVVFDPYVVQTLTLYRHPALLSSAVHVRHELNIQTLRDREVILRMRTDLRLAKPAEFFSDQNGLQFIRRRTSENVALEANYYPLTSGAFMDDGERRVSLLTAQPHGVASLEPGWLEVMLDRHLLYDDGRGLEEGVQDIKPAVSEFLLMVEQRPDGARRARDDVRTAAHHAFPSLLSLSLSDRLQQPPQVFYSQVDSDVFFATFQPMKVALPCDLALLSLRSLATGNLNYNGTSLIVHRRAYDCDFTASDLQCAASGAALTFEAMFKGFGLGVQSVKETSLTHLHHKRSLSPSAPMELWPMQIASYHLTF